MEEYSKRHLFIVILLCYCYGYDTVILIVFVILCYVVMSSESYINKFATTVIQNDHTTPANKRFV